LAMLGADRRDGLLGALLHLVDAEDLGTFAREEDGGGLAVAEARAARAGAGDDRDLAVQAAAHRTFTARTAGRDSRPTTGGPRRRRTRLPPAARRPRCRARDYRSRS